MVSTNNILILAVACGIFLLGACHAGENNPGRTYAPDMFYSQAVETYTSSEVTENGISAILPPEHTVAYGNQPTAEPDPSFMPFPIPLIGKSDTAGLHSMFVSLSNPVAKTAANMVEGQRLYGIYCGICHGAEGDGKGYIVTNGAYTAAPPTYFSANLLAEPESYLFYITQYGKGSMGSYAGQLSKEQRWKVIAYVRQMQNDYIAAQNAANEAEASAATNTTETLN